MEYAWRHGIFRCESLTGYAKSFAHLSLPALELFTSRIEWHGSFCDGGTWSMPGNAGVTVKL
jgi:hypothetical protein